MWSSVIFGLPGNRLSSSKSLRLYDRTAGSRSLARYSSIESMDRPLCWSIRAIAVSHDEARCIGLPVVGSRGSIATSPRPDHGKAVFAAAYHDWDRLESLRQGVRFCQHGAACGKLFDRRLLQAEADHDP